MQATRIYHYHFLSRWNWLHIHSLSANIGKTCHTERRKAKKTTPVGAWVQGASSSLLIHSACNAPREDWMLRGPRSSSFWFPRNLSDHMVRQARTGDTGKTNSRGMTGIGPKHCRAGGWGRRGKDDRKQNALAPLNAHNAYKKDTNSYSCNVQGTCMLSSAYINEQNKCIFIAASNIAY